MTDATALNGVPETLLIPLFYRAKETQSSNPLICDKKAVEIVDSLQYDFSMCNKWLTQISVVSRLEIFQDAIKDFLKENPDAIVINIAAGLDNLFDDVDNGRVQWFDLDFPQVIDIRKKYIKETERRKFIASDALDFNWMNTPEIKNTDKPVLVVAEGLLPYLPEEKARLLLSTIADNFKNCRVILDIFGSFTVGREWLVSEFKHIKPTPSFLWSPRDPYEIGNWDKRFKILKVENLFDRHPKRWRSMRFMFKFNFMKNMMGNRCIILDLHANNSNAKN